MGVRGRRRRRAQARFANIVAAELYERALAAAAHFRPRRTTTSRACARRSATSVSASVRTTARSTRSRRRATLVGGESALLDARLLGKQIAAARALRPVRGGARASARGLARLDERSEGPERDASRATIELNAGAIHYRQTNNAEAIRWLEAAAEHAERAGDRRTLATRTTSRRRAQRLRLSTACATSSSRVRSTRSSATFAASVSCSRTSASMRTTRDAGTSRSRSTARAATRRSARDT